MKEIKNVKIVEEIKHGFRVEWKPIKKYKFNSMALIGMNRPKNCKVGDKGKLVYKSSGSLGLWYFEKKSKGV